MQIFTQIADRPDLHSAREFSAQMTICLRREQKARGQLRFAFGPRILEDFAHLGVGGLARAFTHKNEPNFYPGWGVARRLEITPEFSEMLQIHYIQAKNAVERGGPNQICRAGEKSTPKPPVK